MIIRGIFTLTFILYMFRLGLYIFGEEPKLMAWKKILRKIDFNFGSAVVGSLQPHMMLLTVISSCCSIYFTCLHV